jgi:hypothetical protein
MRPGPENTLDTIGFLPADTTEAPPEFYFELADAIERSRIPTATTT